MRIVFMGTPEYVIPVLQNAIMGIGQIVGVYCQPDKPAGRGLKKRIPAVKAYAKTLGIKVFQPTSFHTATAQRELAALQPELIVVAAYGKLLPQAVLNLPVSGCLNIHPSLLPRHRGPSPVVTCILEGDRLTGVTIMKLDEGMDTGTIIAQRSTEIGPTESTEQLTTRLFALGSELLSEVIAPWIRGELENWPQDSSLATITHKIERADGEANWKRSSEDLARRVRGLAPWPGLFTHWNGNILKILKASHLTHVTSMSPGLVLFVPGTLGGVGVTTGDGILILERVQLEGRRHMNGAEFAKGYRDFIGTMLPN
jgi:methionyl-tRNA formyltransferase